MDELILDPVPEPTPATVVDPEPNPDPAPAPPPKKKPGRPPKKKVDEAAVKRFGIVTTPISLANDIELQYMNPSAFKKVFLMLKKYKVSDVDLDFGHDGMRIVTPDQLKKSDIFIDVHGKEMNHYYCAAPMILRVSRAAIDRVLMPINKENFSMVIEVAAGATTSFRVTLRNESRKTTISTPVNMTKHVEIPVRPVLNDAEYPLSFTIQSKQFKEDIRNTMKGIQVISFQKVHGSPLQIRANGDNGADPCLSYEEINMVDRLDPLDVLNVSLCTEHISPFTDSIVGDSVTISIDPVLPTSFKSDVDKYDTGYAITVKVYTNIRAMAAPELENGNVDGVAI